MASLNLNEQLFIRTLTRELGITEIALEAAVSEALLRAGYVEVTFSNRFGGLVTQLDEDDMSRKKSYGHTDFDSAKARLGRG